MSTAGITFILSDNRQVHTFTDLNLKQLSGVTVSPPVPKRHLITEVPGMDGQLEVNIGHTRFENRTITIRFEGQDQDYGEWYGVCSRVENALHGRYAEVVSDMDPDWYWYGFLTVTPAKEAMAYSELEIFVDVFPYKLRRTEYLEKAEVSDSSLFLLNDRMPAYPVIVSDAALEVTVNGKTYALGAGRNEPDFELSDGENVLEFTGTGNVEISWRGGSL